MESLGRHGAAWIVVVAALAAPACGPAATAAESAVALADAVVPLFEAT